MCGIAGFAGPDAPSMADAVSRMLDSLRHRGPDAGGVWVSPTGRCVLGHRRLSILDLSESSAQPMVMADPPFALTYNGECYNYQPLRAELEGRGARFRSTGDTEVVLRLLAEDGPEAAARLNGMFALGLWDESRRRLHLARDYFGQKPLYWAKHAGGVLFSSEVRALLASGVIPRRIDVRAVRGFLAYGAVQGPDTIVDGVKLLPRRSILTFDAETGIRIIEEPPPPRVKHRVDATELREAFTAAVSRHLCSDVPVGVFLSGGLDSAVVASAVRAAAGPEATALTVTFPEEPSESETEAARRAAACAEVRHVEVPVTQRDVLADLDRAIAALDQPSIDGVNTYVVSRAAREAGLTVALAGVGSDELFGGYSTFSEVPAMARLQRVLKPAWPVLRRAVRQGGDRGVRYDKILEAADASPGIVPCYLIRRRLFTSREVDRLLGAPHDRWSDDLADQRFAELTASVAGSDPADAVGELELNVYMGETLLRDGDVMGMAHSLEIRMPFLDKEFASLVLALPSASRRRAGGYRKWPLLQAFEGRIPADTGRTPKRGFSFPWDRWLRGALSGSMSEEIQAAGPSCGLAVDGSVPDVWRRFLSRSPSVGWSKPWALFVLGRYVRQNRLSC